MVLFTIIIPFQKESAYLRQTLDHLAEQTLQSFEVALIPDGVLNPEFRLTYAFPVRVAFSGPVSPAIKRYFFCSAKGGIAMETRKIAINEYIKGIAFLDIDEQLTLLEVISAWIKKSIIKKRNKNSIMELEGLGSDIWKGIEAQEYVNKERSSSG